MRVDPSDLSTVNPKEIYRLPTETLGALAEKVLPSLEQDRRENQLFYYRAVSEKAQRIHESSASVVGVGGGNGSSKTETCLVDLIMCATGVFPFSQRHLVDQKFRGPINCRVVLESLTTTLHPVILPKLQWFTWTGESEQGGPRGHWGWVPRDSLKDRNWERSWSEKLRTLTVLCRDPKNPEKVLGYSTIQFMSHDQEPSSFASGDYHKILLDEPPQHAIWVENQARRMRVAGQIMLAMTWPDDPAIPVDWIYDEIYEKGLEGPNKNPDIDWFELYTTDNPHLNQESVQQQMKDWSDETRNVRIFGRPIRFSNLIHPLFTDIHSHWCYTCHKECMPQGRNCGCDRRSEDISDYCHVLEFDHQESWPVVFLLDPHPRKPHMFLWAQVDPSDDLWVIADGEVDGDPVEVRNEVFDIEEAYGLNVVKRLIDPNMGRSPSSAQRREVTWQEEFQEAGLSCDLASDSDVGRARINEYLKPEAARLQPRIHVHSRCQTTSFQMKRYTWDEHRRKDERDAKQTPRPKYDDYPTLLKYLLNEEPSFSFLHAGPRVLHRAGTRRSGY